MTGGVATPVHGGPDGGPPAAVDFSSNANALGPSPMARAALDAADPGDYPDPAYTAVRRALADLHDRDPAEVVVGAGACELIHRAVRAAGGPVVVGDPTFGEYRYAAQLACRDVRTAADRRTFVRHLPGAALAVLCVPSVPVGVMPAAGRLADLAAHATATGCRLLLDLAYHPLSQARPAPPVGAWQLWAPNKAHGVTGVRAGYLLAPAADAARLRAAPSWVLSAHGEAFLRCLPDPAAQAWVRDTRATLWRWRDDLVTDLTGLGVPVDVGDATFLLAHVGDGAAVTVRLRDCGIRVRDASSFGAPDAVRLSAQPPPARAALTRALADVLPAVPR